MPTRRYHQNNFATNLTSNQTSGVTTTPLNSIPSVAAPFYIALDATNINSKYEVVEVTSKTATNINHAATTYAHTTAEEVRMVVPAAELDEISLAISTGTAAADGWVTVSDTWTYASATTITVPTGAASLYQKGDKIKLTQTTPKYFTIVTVADTLLTVTGGIDYTVANAAITSPYYSKAVLPLGFPDWFNFTPTVGWNGTPPTTPTTVAKFKILGKQLFFIFKQANTGAGVANSQVSIDGIPVSTAGVNADYNYAAHGFASTAAVNSAPTTNAKCVVYSQTPTVYLFFDASIAARCAWASGSFEI